MVLKAAEMTKTQTRHIVDVQWGEAREDNPYRVCIELTDFKLDGSSKAFPCVETFFVN